MSGITLQGGVCSLWICDRRCFYKTCILVFNLEKFSCYYHRLSEMQRDLNRSDNMKTARLHDSTRDLINDLKDSILSTARCNLHLIFKFLDIACRDLQMILCLTHITWSLLIPQPTVISSDALQVNSSTWIDHTFSLHLFHVSSTLCFQNNIWFIDTTTNCYQFWCSPNQLIHLNWIDRTFSSISFMLVSSSQRFVSRTIYDFGMSSCFFDFFSAYSLRCMLLTNLLRFCVFLLMCCKKNQGNKSRRYCFGCTFVVFEPTIFRKTFKHNIKIVHIHVKELQC